MTTTKNKFNPFPVFVSILLAAVALLGCRTAKAPAPPVPPPAAAQPAARPAVLFASAGGGGCDFAFANRLVRDGFEVNSVGQGMEEAPLSWDQVKPYNVLVLTGIGIANGDGTLSDQNRQNIAVIRRFMAVGGGVLFVPSWGQIDRLIPAQVEFLKPLGLTPLFEEMVFDRQPPVRATAWKIPFSYTTEVRPAPITAGVKALWLPVATRAGGGAHTVPLAADSSWQTVVTGAASTYTITVPTALYGPTAAMTKGRFASRVPLVAMRSVGQGRLVVSGISSTYLWERWAGLTLEGVTLDRGLHGQPSDGYQLVLSSLRWLAAPSLAGGDPSTKLRASLGGAKTSPAQLENPFIVKFIPPQDWTTLATAPFPHVDKTWPGVIGARTALSGGKGTVAEWVAKAKSLGLGYLVFLEDFAALSAARFKQLETECAKLTTADFAAIPGFRIRDEIGNDYFYAGPSLLYPPQYLLSDDGQVFVSSDLALSPKDPRAIKGQLSSTTFTYVYQLGGFKLTAGNYFFHRGAAPVANWFAGVTALGVITRQNGKVVDDATPEYLQLIAAGQAPLPLAVDLLDDPEQLAQTPWRTVLRMKAGDQTVAGKLDGVNPVAAYFGHWNFYPDTPTRVYITDGPQIDYWSSVGASDYVYRNRGDFVWQGYRWRVGGKVRSAAGLKEVAVYDGPKLFRRFLPGGAPEFAFTLDLEHDRQHDLVVLATDNAGHRAISAEQWDRNNRLQEVSCGDRNNQLTGGFTARRQDDTLVLMGGGQCLTVPYKRVIDFSVPCPSPVGAFNVDAFLGAPAFDGAPSGEPNVTTTVSLQTRAGQTIRAPTVGDARRVLTSGDVNIDEAGCGYRFTDNVLAFNFAHSLWRTAASADFVTDQRNYFFQIDPDSPLAVLLWRIRYTLRADIPTAHAAIGSLNINEANLWAVRGSDGTTLAGNNEETARSTPCQQSLPFNFGGYAAALDSPMGGCAVFPLTDGLTVNWQTPQTGHINFELPGAVAPQRKGESRQIDLLLVGIPRSTKYTRMFPPRTTQVVERFRRDFGLSGSGPSYQVTLTAGQITSQRYLLRVDGAATQAFAGVIEGDLISTLPIVVSGLNDRWSAFLYDRQLHAARPLGVAENQAWATVPVHGKQDLFVGHPVTCDNRDVVLQLTQTGPNQWRLEAHNPTNAPLTVTLRANPLFDPLHGKTLPPQPVVLPAGVCQLFDL